MDSFGIIPVRLLGGGRLALTEGAAEAFGAATQVDWTAQDRQMAQQTRRINTVLVADDPSATLADRVRQGGFDREDNLTGRSEIGL